MDNQETHIEHCNHTIIEKNQKNIFLYTTITGNLQVVHFEEIGYFRYNSKSKLWEVVLYNKHTLISVSYTHLDVYKRQFLLQVIMYVCPS